ncbi:MAG: hypothetical protein ABIF92_01410 [archaeon]
MKKIILSLLIVTTIVALSGCVQFTGPSASGIDVACDASTPCQSGYTCLDLPKKGAICVLDEFAKNPCSSYECPTGTDCAVLESYPAQVRCFDTEAAAADDTETETSEKPAGDTGLSATGAWCEPSEIAWFVDPHIQIDEVSVFIDKEYDKDFGPNKVTSVFKGDELIGYAELTLPDAFKYSDFLISARLVNGDEIALGQSFTESDLDKYGNYHYKYWEGFKALNTGEAQFELKLSYSINDEVQTQCENYSLVVNELEGTDVSDQLDYSKIIYSRSRIFQIEGNFSKSLYTSLNNQFKATFLTENIDNPAMSVEVPFVHLNKIVCVEQTCYFKSEVNLPKDRIDNYTAYDQWCGEDFKTKIRIDRGSAQPLFSDLPDGLDSSMCNKLKIGW